MITASEARAKTLDVTQNSLKQQIDKIESDINRAIKKGELRCYIYFSIHRDVRKYLTSLGYHIGSDQGRQNECCIPITWGVE